MANQAPTITGTAATSIKEGTSSTYARTGTLSFADADATDRLVVDLAGQSLIYKNAGGTDLTANLSASQLAALLQGFSIPTGALGSNRGSATWTYAIADTGLDFLGANDTVTITTTVRVTDSSGAATTKDVVVTLAGVNDAPLTAAGSTTTGMVAEAAGKAGDTTVTSQQGTIAFTDADLTDAHTITVAAKAGGYAGTMTASLVADTTGGQTGAIAWTYSVADKALDWLAAGQQLAQTYTISIADGKGGVLKQDVTVVLAGADDAPTISGGSGIAIIEGTASSYAKSGTMNFSDLDVADRPTTSISSQTFSWKSSTGVDLTPLLTPAEMAAIANAFQMPVGDLASNKGSATWTYTLADSAIDFLGRNDTLTFTTNVTVDDHNGGTATKGIVVTLTGVNDAPVIETLGANDPKVTGTLTEAAGVTGSSATDTVSGSFAFTDLDVNDVHYFNVKALGTGYVGTFTPVMTADTTGGGTGSIGWSYKITDKAIDWLGAGESLTQTWQITIADSKTGSVTQNVTVNLIGSDDPPVLSGSTTQTTIYEPSASVTGPITRGGTIAISDADVHDHLTVTAGTPVVHVYAADGTDLTSLSVDALSADQAATVMQAQALASHLTLTTTANGTAGSIGWSYSVDPSELSFLSNGETVKITADVVVQDYNAADVTTGAAIVQPISVTLVGTTPDLSVKDYVGAVVAGTYTDAIAGQMGVGVQMPTAELRPYTVLGPQDGATFKAPITIAVTTDGATFDGIDFRGKQVVVQANNVSFVNCLFDDSASLGQPPLTIVNGVAHTTVDHCTFDGLKSTKFVADFITSQGTDTVLSNNYFLNASVDGVWIESGVVTGNYFVGGGYNATGHSDAIWVPETQGSVLIANNVIDWRTPPDATVATNNAIRISSEEGNIDGVTVRDNVLIGGNYSITVTKDATWTHTADQMGTITNVSIYDNIIDLGATGAIDPLGRPSDLVIFGNGGLTGSGVAFGAGSVADLPSLAGLATTVFPSGSPAEQAGAHVNYVVGGTVSDTMAAPDGAVNIIQGGLGRDYVTGGGNGAANIFLYKSLAEGNDWIKQFNDATDKIDLSSLVELQSLGLHASDWNWLGGHAFTGSARQIYYTYNASLDRTTILIDVNGDLATDMQIQLSGKHDLTTDNFILERADPVTSVLGSLWAGQGIDATTKTATLPFSFAAAPLEIVDGVVVLRDSDGTILPIGDMNKVVFTDGSITRADGNPLIDDLFYNVAYKATLGGIVDAEADWANGGWQAGRDPNAYFSTAGYLAVHPELAAAGIDPLQQWATVGWTLGWDPSADFDVKTYLLRYGSQIAPGVDPLTDWLTVGRAAGRVAYGAIGDNIGANGFDAEYYLLAHPEVASSGMDPYQHWLTVGVAKGWDPNAFFDVSYYLAQNPAAASAADPLADFLSTGWKAGYDPSADFDVALYLKANPDVAASGVNPLVEFLQYGANEGRIAFGVGASSTDTAPVAVADQITVVGNAYSATAATGVLANDSDADGNTLTVKAVAHDALKVGAVVHGAHGDLTLNADGSYLYTVTDTSGPVGSPLYDTFNYVVTDGLGFNSSASLTVRVDRAGTAVDDTAVASIVPGSSLTVDAAHGVLANDGDPDGAVGVLGVAGSPPGTTIAGLYGTLTLAADGSYVYTRTVTSIPVGATDQFTYTVGDGVGPANTAVLSITLSNPASPTIVGTTAGGIVEGAALPTVSGTLSFAEAAAGVELTTSIVGRSVTWLDTSGIDHTAQLSSGAIAALLGGFTMPVGSLGGNNGSAGWTYQIGNAALDFLGKGETLQIVTTVQVADGFGGSATQDVVVTVTGTNDAPTISGGTTGATLTEAAGQTGATTVVTQQGSLSFADLDLTDAHVVSVSTPAGAKGYAGTLTASVAADTTGGGTGTINWIYSVADKALDFLAAGQTQVQSYLVTLTDGKGGTTSTTVAVTLVGTDDAPVVTGTVSASWYEGSATTYNRVGTLYVTDPDATDHVTTSVVGQSLGYTTAGGVDMTAKLTAAQIQTLTSAFSIATGDLGSNKGTAGWTYTISDSAIDFIGQNDQIKLVETIAFSDGNGGVVNQDVTVTIKGINDAPIFAPNAAGSPAIATTVSETAGVSGDPTAHVAIGTLAFADADLSDVHTVKATAKGTGYYGTFTPVVSQDTTGGGAGAITWTFQVADKALDGLAAGQTLTQTYTIQVNDGKSGVASQDVTVTLVGASDQFVFNTTAAQALKTFVAGDTIAVAASAFGGGLAAGSPLDASWLSTGTAATVAGHGQFFQDSTQKLLYWDVDGTGAKAPVLVASFSTAQVLHAADIVVI